jgi:photosystem II stability/assembly factor-like uncharacterized protein
MKRFSVLLIAIVGLHNLVHAQTGWTVQNAGISSLVRSVKSLNRQVGWISADGGVIRRTIDGGATWQVIPSPTSFPYSITAVDSLIAMVAHYTSAATSIFRTTNAGASWQEVFNQPGGFIDALIMLDRNIGFALGDPVNGKWTILKTTNGGATWQHFDNEPLQIGSEYGWTQSFCTIGTRFLWFGSNESKIYRSTDAGVSWSYSAAPSALCSAVSFADSVNGVAGFYDGAVAYSSDGGATWTPVTVAGFGSIWGIATDGTRSFWLPRADTVFVSTDHGRTWRSQFASPLGGYLRDIHFSRDGSVVSGWVGSSTGGVARYFAQAPPTPGWTEQNSGVTSVLYSVKAIDENTGWFAGLGGIVGRTVNSGNTWQQVGDATIPDIYNMEAVDANTALVAATTPPLGGNTYIYRTSNGGTSWQRVYSLVAPGAYIDCIKMFNAQYGIAVGDPLNGKWVVLKTTDGGLSWSRLPNEPVQIGSEIGVYHILSLVSATDIRFVAGTSGTRMYKSTDGGSTWSNYELPFPSNSYALSLWFNNPQFGAAGSSTSTAARTTDGGVTWIPVTLPGPGTWGLSGYGNTFFAANWHSVYQSTDNGETWSPSYQPNVGQFIDVSFVNRSGIVRGWASAGYGRLYSYYAQLTSIHDGGSPETPSGFELLQNYPNPFNPFTTIKFSVEETNRTTLDVYNILGQRVATLFDEVAEAGRYYKVRFDASQHVGMASGVYIYRLQSGKRSDLKKLLLLK